MFLEFLAGITAIFVGFGIYWVRIIGVMFNAREVLAEHLSMSPMNVPLPDRVQQWFRNEHANKLQTRLYYLKEQLRSDSERFGGKRLTFSQAREVRRKLKQFKHLHDAMQAYHIPLE